MRQELARGMGGMSWAKLDDGFHSHPKVVGTSLEAIGLFVISLSWAANHETDGMIPSHVAFFLSRNRVELCDELVQRALWERDETGFIVHDYLDYNPSSASIAKKRKEQAKATRKWRRSRERSVIDHSKISVVSPSTGRDGTGNLSVLSSSRNTVLLDTSTDTDDRDISVFRIVRGAILAMAPVPDRAASTHDLVEATLRSAGLHVEREVSAELPNGNDGRIDLLASLPGQTVAIEIDGRTARSKSMYKLAQFPLSWRMILLRGGHPGVAVPEEIDCVISLAVNPLAVSAVPRIEQSREVRLPEPFDLTDAMREFGTKAGIDVPYEFGKFKDYHRAHGTRHVDWVSAWRYWVRNGLERLERAQERRR